MAGLHCQQGARFINAVQGIADGVIVADGGYGLDGGFIEFILAFPVECGGHVDDVLGARVRADGAQALQRGQQDVFIDNLPGLPDNLQGDRHGTFWVALPTPRKADADFLHRHPWLKAQLAKLPRALWPKAVPYGLVVALNEQGEIVQSLHDSSGTHLRMITSAKPVGDYLYLGSLDNDRIGKLKIR